MGQMALRMSNRNYNQVIGFADNNLKLQGGKYCELPVYSVSDAIGLAPDAILITVAGEDRTKELKQQLINLGYKGEIRTLRDYMTGLDIRSGVLTLLAERIRNVPGDMAELGVYQGDFACQLNRLFPERKLYLFDTFTGFDERDVKAEQEHGYSRAEQGEFGDTSIDRVLAKMPVPDQIIPRVGYFPDTAEGIDASFALVSLDVDLYQSTLAGLRWFYPRMASGAVMIVHDYHNPRFSGVKEAVREFEEEQGRLLMIPVGDAHGTVVIIHP